MPTGVWHEIFNLTFFSWISFPWAPGAISNFYENSQKYSQFVFIAGINDTGDKLFTGVNDTGEKLLPVENFSVSKYFSFNVEVVDNGD